ncbi:MAG: hypothetical protein IRZ16_22285 [Myxococcaceae bacterium]|nr:hypothetical protein [Myxococcaceae bacterium]
MKQVERTMWSNLSEPERAELLEVVRGKDDRYVSDYLDAVAFWLLGVIAGVAGMVATGVMLEGDFGFDVFAQNLPRLLWESIYPPGFIASAVVTVWIAVTWIRNHKRRGVAVTSFATIRVKGRKLILLRHAHVADVKRTLWVGRNRPNYTELELHAKDGSKLGLYCTGNFANIVQERIGAVRGETANAA